MVKIPVTAIRQEMAMTSSTALTATMAAIFERSDVTDSNNSDDDDPPSSDDAAMPSTWRNFLMRMCDLNNCCLESRYGERSTTDVAQAEVMTLLMNDGRKEARKHICRKQVDLDVATVAQWRRSWALKMMNRDRVPHYQTCSVLQEKGDWRGDTFLQNQLPSLNGRNQDNALPPPPARPRT